MKKLNLKDEEVQNLLCELEDNGWDEVITKGEVANSKKMNTFYDCKRTYKLNGKTYIGEWSCNSKYGSSRDGAYNTEEYINALYEVSNEE